MAKMREADLTAILAAEKADALSAMQAAKLTEERTRAMDYYNGDVSKDMPSVTDRSKAVSYDVSDTVEGLMPALMEIFAGGDEVVKFAPISQEDEAQAEQETAYINHVYMDKNPGFINTYSFVKDALLSKNGILKIWWEVKEDEERRTLLNQPHDSYMLLATDPEIEIVEHTEHPPEYAPQALPPPGMAMQPEAAAGGAGIPPAGPEAQMPGPAPMAEAAPDMTAMPTHDVTIVKRRKYGCCKVEPVPPEEFGVGRTAKLGQPLDYCYHETVKTQAALINQGFDAEQIKGLPDAALNPTGEATARDTVDERTMGDANNINRANRLIEITEHYAMLDYEDEGKACLYRVTTGGDDNEMQVLKRDGKPDIEKVAFDPFAAITPYIVTHRFFGKSAADLVIDIQRIKTSLTRALLDNAWLANNGRLEVAESHAHPKTLDDILDNRIGGIVRTKQPGGLLPIPNQEIGSFIFPMIEYQDAVREWRTGVTRQGQGLDPDALQNIGEQAVIRAQNAAMEKTKLIARIFAETGFKDLFWKIHATVRANEDSRPTFQVTNKKWVTVNPLQWKRRDDLTASVGLGGGSKSEMLAFWGQVLSSQNEAMNQKTGLTRPGLVYNALRKFMELGGERAVDKYWQNPDEQPPQPPEPDPKMLEAEGKLKIKEAEVAGNQAMQAQKLEADKQAQAAKINAEREQMVAKHNLEREQMAAEFRLKAEQMVAEYQLKQQQMEMERDLEREGMRIDAAVQVKTAPVRMGGKVG